MRTLYESVCLEFVMHLPEKHECDFTSRPQNPKNGDVLILNCSVVFNGFWNATLVFRSDFDETVTRGEVSECGIQPSVGHRICSTVKVKAGTTIFAYSCLLEFASEGRHDPINSMFKHSQWTAAFNRKVVCNLPKTYITCEYQNHYDPLLVILSDIIHNSGQFITAVFLVCRM